MTIPVVQAQLDDLRRSDAEALRRRAGDDPDLDPSVARSAPSRTSYRGLEVLIVYLQARRGHLFEHFRDFWIAQEKAGTWNRLERAAEHQLELAKERRRAEREAEQAREELEQAELAEREARERAARAQAELERTSLSG
jgi:multidrug resistance efflux pump